MVRSEEGKDKGNKKGKRILKEEVVVEKPGEDHIDLINIYIYIYIYIILYYIILYYITSYYIIYIYIYIYYIML